VHWIGPLVLIQAKSLGALLFNLGKTEPPSDSTDSLIFNSSSGKVGGGKGCSETGRRKGPESSRSYHLYDGFAYNKWGRRFKLKFSGWRELVNLTKQQDFLAQF